MALQAGLRILIFAVLFFFVPGYVLWAAFGIEEEDDVVRLSCGEVLFLIILASTLLTSWIGLILAETGYFSLRNLAFLLTSGCLILLLLRRKRLRLATFPRPRLDPGSLVLGVIVIVAAWLFFRPYEYIVGGRDSGVYVNTGALIAQRGSIVVTDTVLAQAPAESRPLLVVSPDMPGPPSPKARPRHEGQRVLGYALRDLDRGIAIPHALHLYPVYLAVLYAVGGLPLALRATPALILLGSLGLYFVTKRLFSHTTALLALFLLVINISQIWYARYPSAEALVQYLFWAGLLAFVLTARSRSRYMAFLAGCCFGQINLAKLDIVFIPPILLLFFLYLWLRDRFRHEYRFFIWPYLLLGLHALLHVTLISTIYFLDQIAQRVLPKPLDEVLVRTIQGYTYPLDIFARLVKISLMPVLGGLLLVGLVAAGLVIFKKPLARRLATWRHPSLYLVFTVAVSLLGLYAYFVWPYTPSGPGKDALLHLGWYVTPLGVLLGLAGFLQAVGERAEQGRSLALLLIFSGSSLLLVMGPGTSPDHFWAIRRFVPVVIPAFIIFSSYALCRLKPKSWAEWILPLCLGAALAVGYLQTDRGLVRFVEYQGTIEWVEQFAHRFPPNSILLFELSSSANAVATPLWAIFERPAFLVAEPDARLTETVRAWQAEGRDVYWISSEGQSAPAGGDYIPDYLFTSVLSTAVAELSTDHLPRQKWEYTAAFDTYKIVPSRRNGRVKRVFTVNVGEQGDEDYLREGFYPAETTLGWITMRWTQSEAVIALPLAGEPASIIFRAAGGRPPGVPQARATIYLDDYPVGELVLETAFKTYSLSIPEGSAPASAVRLRLETSTWNPAQDGYNPDTRDLGIQLDWVKVVTIER